MIVNMSTRFDKALALRYVHETSKPLVLSKIDFGAKDFKAQRVKRKT